MRIGDFVRPELVLTGVTAPDARSAIAALTAQLPGEPQLRVEVEGALCEREEAHTTALSVGVAVPHATLPGLAEPMIGVATAPAGIPFGPEQVPVRVLFLLLSPPEKSTLHIKLLARIARLARRPQFVERLAAATSPAEVVEALEQAEHET